MGAERAAGGIDGGVDVEVGERCLRAVVGNVDEMGARRGEAVAGDRRRCIVIGSGAAGLTLALNLPSDLRIAVLSKGDLSNGSTYWAQGGVAAVLDTTDTLKES